MTGKFGPVGRGSLSLVAVFSSLVVIVGGKGFLEVFNGHLQGFELVGAGEAFSGAYVPCWVVLVLSGLEDFGFVVALCAVHGVWVT
jgi:hypothetical protein